MSIVARSLQAQVIDISAARANHRFRPRELRVTISIIGYMLIALGLSITLLAMALDAWTHLGELELISAYVGLITSIVAAVILTTDAG